MFNQETFAVGDITGSTSSQKTRITSMQNLYLEKGSYTFSWNGISPFRFAIQGQIVHEPPVKPYPTLSYDSGWLKASTRQKWTFTLNQPMWIDVCLSKENNAELTLDEISKFDYQIEKGNQATYIEPYGYKDKWYIEKNVDMYNSWTEVNLKTDYTNTSRFQFVLPSATDSTKRSLTLCNYFENAINNNDAEHLFIGTSTPNIYDGLNVFISKTRATTNTEAINWLKSNNVKVYYVLANPTYTLIENEELIEQLDRIHLEQGLNNVMISSSNLPSSVKMTYVSNLIGIDEDYLKNINVNFGEKYGPINSLVIARAADSDFIYKEDEQSVEEDGLCEVKISDNQILNDDNRVQFIDGMFNQLRGTEFYLNDFSSTGIAFFDLLDYYKIKVFDNTYKCLMLNDELDITQGLQEQIYTDRPEESETKYKSIAKQDKDIKKIGIIVNKVEGEIAAEVEARKGTDSEVSRVSQTSSEINERLEATETTLYDSEDGLVKKVTSHSLDIKKTADGLEIEVGRVDVLDDGVKALDDNTKDIRDNFLFNEDGLTIRNKGSSTEDMTLNLTNDAIKFLYQNHAVLTINGSKIEFSSASFKKLDLGNYVWQAEDDDSLSLIYEGDNN